MHTTGRNVLSFARKATKVVLSDDQAVIDSLVITPDYSFVVDYKEFLREFAEQNLSVDSNRSKWIAKCNDWRENFKNIYGKSKQIDADGRIYALNVINKLNVILGSDDAVVSDGGLSLIYLILGIEVKLGQRLISTTGLESMGIGLPGAIGVALGNKKGNTICICESGTIDLHMQDLNLIKKLNLPIKILLFNGKRQSLLRGIQKDYFGERYVGTDHAISAVNNLSIELARLNHFAIYKVHELQKLETVLLDWYESCGPAICEIEIEDDYEYLPKPGFIFRDDQTWVARPLEDQLPLLAREELIRNMIIPLDDE
jgi:acetolactate synthase-1/2/3 large subunit